MYNQLCEKCIHHCKQDESAKILQCPRFQKRLTDNEFKDLIDELDGMEKKAKDLKKRTENLIRLAQTHEIEDTGEYDEETGSDEFIDEDADTTGD